VNRAVLIVTVAFAGYAVISSLLALIVGVVWRADYAGIQIAPARRATRLVALRITPSALGLILSAGVVLPVFLAFEPVRDSEPVGPLLILLAVAGLVTVFAAARAAVRAVVLTSRVKRQWLRSASALDIDPPAGVPAYVIEAPSPMVALVGVFSPRLVAARAVIEVCSSEELAAIVAHERGHLHARDNLKRWLLTCAPDALRWTPVHASIMSEWRSAAEDAADDVATGGEEAARVDLAALLVKIARLAPSLASPAAVSPFADKEGLDRRVHRLLAPTEHERASSRQLLIPAIVGTTALAVVVAITSPASLKQIYEMIELTVALGR
jgi:Zn-dependent protease with chaperone function